MATEETLPHSYYHMWQACNIVGFFDADGDGKLSYAEFMTFLQDSKKLGL